MVRSLLVLALEVHSLVRVGPGYRKGRNKEGGNAEAGQLEALRNTPAGMAAGQKSSYRVPCPRVWEQASFHFAKGH